MPTPSRVCWTGTFAVCAVLLPLLAACSNEPPTSVRPTFDAAAAPPSFLRSNTVKYSDAGSHPATGRAGSATLTSRALLAKDGSTMVEATTGALDNPATPPGQIASVQLKQLRAQGVSTSNYVDLAAGGYWTDTYTTLARGDRVQLQTDIRGIDANRTDVVTVVDTVKRRPDLAASGFAAPATASVNSVVHVAATITELNGDVGAHADCVLLADGQPISTAQGIWVDAGDAVTCAFVTTFSTTGAKHLTISAENVQPADWDATNNSVSGTIEIVSSEIRLAWSSNLWGMDETFDQQYSDAYYSYSLTGFMKSRTITTSASVNDATSVGDNLTMSATLTSDGTVLGTASVPMNTISWYDSNCRSGFDPATNTNFAFCHTPAGVTSMSAQSYSTSTVYYGQEYYKSSGYTYIDNVNTTAGFGAYAVGATMGFDIKATDERGTVWHAPAAVPVTAYTSRDVCQNTATSTCSGYIEITAYSGRASGH